VEAYRIDEFLGGERFADESVEPLLLDVLFGDVRPSGERMIGNVPEWLM